MVERGPFWTKFELWEWCIEHSQFLEKIKSSITKLNQNLIVRLGLISSIHGFRIKSHTRENIK